MKKINILLCVFILIAIFITFYKQSQVPGCINADEAAFGYNAFSILKTMRDEHGAFLPLRLLSFNDMKLPLYSYLSIPFIAVFGLNSFSTRLVSNTAGVLLVPFMYYFALELFKNKKIAYLASFLTSISPWVYIMSRHAHETGLSALLIGISMWMLVRFIRTKSYGDMGFSLISIFLATLSYHTARIFLVFITIFFAAFFIRNLLRSRSLSGKKFIMMFFLVLVFATPFLIDIRYGTSRVNNLLFFHNTGFQQKLDEYIHEDPNRLLHNKLTQSMKEVGLRFFQEISPEFLVVNGDANPRFGMDWFGPITPVEYIFIYIGLYFLFNKKVKNRFILIAFLLLSPLNNAFTWSTHSLTRTYPMIIPMLLLASYGCVELFQNSKHIPRYLKTTIFVSIVAVFAFYNVINQDLYFNHYFDRALHVRSWQCGYKDLAAYVKDNYNSTGSFYFTRRYGQPYVFLLYFMQYDPQKYQNSATLSKPDEYGFSQVERFDKFTFEMPSGSNFPKDSIVVGFPDEFNDRRYDQSRITKIMYGREEIFWIYKTEK